MAILRPERVGGLKLFLIAAPTLEWQDFEKSQSKKSHVKKKELRKQNTTMSINTDTEDEAIGGNVAASTRWLRHAVTA